MKTEKVLGINVCVTGKDELMEAVRQDIAANTQRMIVAINPEKILKARKDEALAKLLNSADYPIADGIGVVIASRMHGGGIRQRITGIGSMELFCAASVKYEWRVFLYGAKPGVAQKAGEALTQKYPGLIVSGIADGYGCDNDALIDSINEARADVLFVALGSPAQEYWIAQNRNRLNVKLFQGVGGSFDVFGGNLKRAPVWMQKYGLEWLFRLALQPKRVFRQFKILGFLLLIVKDWKHSYES